MYRVYFIEDKPLVLAAFMTKPVFLECGFINIGHSVNPRDAIIEIKALRPDVVFTDLKMPGMSGVELMDTLRQCGYEGEFVIVSAYSEFQESRKFFKMEGFDYLLKPVSDNDLLALLETLSVKLAKKRATDYSPIETPSPDLNKITAYLHAHMSEKNTLESIGEKFHIKPNSICNLFSRYLDTTFTAYLTHIRMKEAASLLKTTQKAVKEIALICGYSNYFYFCRVFKDAFSCTPTEYREESAASGAKSAASGAAGQ